jgi:DNA mismatch repair protein MutL
MLERGRHPLAVISLVLDPAEIDVNVHPAKREVRFRQEGAVFAALQRSVRAALDGGPAYQLPVAGTPNSEPARQVLRPAAHRGAELVTVARGEPALPEAPVGSPGPLRPLGQVGEGYLVAEGPDGLVLVDQHAAHERVLYNRFLSRLREGGGPSQALLLPQVIDLSPAQAAALRDHQPLLAQAGFDVEPFGPSQARVAAAPAETPPGRAGAVLEQALTELAEGRAEGRLEAAAASLACHSAVRFGDRMEPGEQRRLLEELERAEDSITCPHGRPTRLVVDWQDLKRHFRRNY